ncbi:MAG: zinc ribbon domain-containing protein [Spongiibacteraceae bacterium]
MPVYDYRCDECDCEFTMLMPMSRSADPMPCPSCEHQAQRVISAPHLSTMRADVRAAHQTNERSAHEPKMMSGGHRCGSGCSHQSHDKQSHSKAEQPALKQVSSAKRPWMLGH